jgi:hypothetical protein
VLAQCLLGFGMISGSGSSSTRKYRGRHPDDHL